MSSTMLAGALVAALLAATDDGLVSFKALVQQSSLIVVARITQTRPAGGGARIATLSVEVQLKGSPAATVERLIRSSPHQSPIPGGRALYFLARTQKAGPFEPVFGQRGVFEINNSLGVPTVYLTDVQMDLPGRLVRPGNNVTAYALDNVLEALGGKRAVPQHVPTVEATYETVEVACERCDLAREVQKELAPHAVDCGVLGPDAGRQLACATESLRLKRPFKVGTWSQTFEGPQEGALIISRDGGAMAISRVDNSGETASCAARVLVHDCASLREFDGGWYPPIRCEPTEPPSQPRELCDEPSRMVLSLGAPKPASALRCAEERRWNPGVSYGECVLVEDFRHRVVPQLDAGNYVCRSFSSDRLACAVP